MKIKMKTHPMIHSYNRSSTGCLCYTQYTIIARSISHTTLRIERSRPCHLSPQASRSLASAHTDYDYDSDYARKDNASAEPYHQQLLVHAWYRQSRHRDGRTTAAAQRYAWQCHRLARLWLWIWLRRYRPTRRRSSHIMRCGHAIQCRSLYYMSIDSVVLTILSPADAISFNVLLDEKDVGLEEASSSRLAYIFDSLYCLKMLAMLISPLCDVMWCSVMWSEVRWKNE